MLDDDKGLTGGMGAISPSPLLTEDLRKQIMDEVINPVAQEMADAGTPYRGILYAGLMMTQDGQKDRV